MKKLAIAYYAQLQGDNYMPIIIEHFRFFITSGLFNACVKLHIGINVFDDIKPTNGVEWVESFFKFSSSKAEGTMGKTEVVVYDGGHGFKNIKEWAIKYSSDNSGCLILFFSPVIGMSNYLKCTVL